MTPLDTAWDAYPATAANPWDFRKVVHLHRRAGFGGTWAEIKRDLKDGPDASVQRFLDGKQTLHTEADYESTAAVVRDTAVASGEIARLKAWWCFRMLLGADPLGEKLTLMWHNHFATGYSKVRDLAGMMRQNEAFRKRARAPFAELLNASVRQPALLAYLDAQTNRKGHANENLGRELMELFALGVGNYSETDVKEAARCLTGWTLVEGKFVEHPERHDDGEKTVLGKTGTFNGSQLVDLLLDQPAVAKRIAWRLCDTFMGEKAVPAKAAASLATGLRERKVDIGWAVGTILKSKLFFDASNIGNKVKSPVEYAIGAARSLEMFDPAPSTLALGDWCGRMGQDLFDPPNVGGWPGGRTWIGARSMILRANFAAGLVEGANVGQTKSYDPTVLPTKYGHMAGANEVVEFHAKLLHGVEPNAGLSARLAEARGRQIATLLISAPETQLS